MVISNRYKLMFIIKNETIQKINKYTFKTIVQLKENTFFKNCVK